MSKMAQWGTNRGRRRTQEERVEQTRSKLIQATIDCIIELGYSRATLTEITRRAGISIGGAQHHFQSKTDLIFAAINHVFTEMHTFLAALPHATGTVEQRIDDMLDQYWAWFSSPTYLAAWELVIGARQDPELLAMIRERMAVGGREIDSMWREIFADCPVDDDELDDLVKFTFATMRGMALIRIFAPDDAPHRQTFERLRDMLRQSLAATESDNQP